MEKKVRKAIAERLKTIRAELRLTQKEFGARMGTSNTYISTLESALTGPGFYTLYKLTKYYNINPLYLLHGKGPVFIDLEEKQEEEPKPEIESKPEPLPLDNDNPQIREMLTYFQRSPMVKYSILGYYSRFVIENKSLIEEDIRPHETPDTPDA